MVDRLCQDRSPNTTIRMIGTGKKIVFAQETSCQMTGVLRHRQGKLYSRQAAVVLVAINWGRVYHTTKLSVRISVENVSVFVSFWWEVWGALECCVAISLVEWLVVLYANFPCVDSKSTSGYAHHTKLSYFVFGNREFVHVGLEWLCPVRKFEECEVVYVEWDIGK